MRDEFVAIVSGWTLVRDFNALTERIEEAAKWMEINGPLNEIESKTIELMIQTQLAWEPE